MLLSIFVKTVIHLLQVMIKMCSFYLKYKSFAAF